MNRLKASGLIVVFVLCSAVSMIPVTATAGQQSRRNQQQAAPNRPVSPPGLSVAQQAHARREIVRTPNFVIRPAQRPDSQLQRYQPRQINPPVFGRPVGQAPVRPRPVNPPIQNHPPIQAPIRRPPIQQRPVDNRPVTQRPIRRPPASSAPTYTPPTQNPVQRPPVHLTPPYQAPVQRRRAPDSLLQKQRRFTRTTDGRAYDNGIRLRRARRDNDDWERRHFRRGHFHYPFYRRTFIRGRTFISPFGFYYGYGAPFIDSAYCHFYPPPVVFVDMPYYNGTFSNGFESYGDQNLLDDSNLDMEEPGLANAVDEITETFRNGDIDALVTLVDPNTSIAVYERGQYKYSLSGNDYLDLTRDAIEETPTISFNIEQLHQVSANVFTASGRHVYRDRSGQPQTMWVSFVLQDISGQWTLTQVETAPAQYRALAPY